MVEWNPVEGLKEIKYEDLQDGDEIVEVSHGGSYHRRTVKNHRNYGDYARAYYLLHREVKEPEGRGDLVEVYVPGEDELIETYIRARPKFADEDFNDDEAWTDSANEATRSWTDILDEVEINQEWAIRTYTATYKGD